MRLNEAQATAVNHCGNLCLEACPGSGKTRTLVAKLAVELEQSRFSVRTVACITYTNAAVDEIESRLASLGVANAERCEVDTIHSFCIKRILAPHAWKLAPFKAGFQLLAPTDERYDRIVDELIASYRLPKKLKEDFERLNRGSGAGLTAIPDEVARAYWKRLDDNGLVDFNSAIYWSAELVSNEEYIARGVASRYRSILVDEFQDTTAAQVTILNSIQRFRRTSFFVVGDPHQSIMGFAGARPALMEAFAKAIEARTDIKLRDNYRSSSNILRLADRLLSREEPLRALGPHRDFVARPTWRRVASMLDGILEDFIPDLERNDIELSDAAILAARWTSLLPIARGLRDRRVPSLGPGTRPYKRSTHLVAPLLEQLAAHLTERTGIRGIRREVGRLVHRLAPSRREHLGFYGDVCSVRMIREVGAAYSLDEPVRDSLACWAEIIARNLLLSGFISPEEASTIIQSARAMLEEIEANRVRHDHRVITVADLGLFSPDSSSLRLMTMHAAKGREFDAVAIVDVFDGHVPFHTARAGDETENEGRRLLYVALTRAKRILTVYTLATPAERSAPSRFLPECFDED